MNNFARETLPILLCHGLNNNPEVMQALATELRKLGYPVKNICLAGHEASLSPTSPGLADWQKDISEAVHSLRSEYPKNKILALGYSLGAALILDNFSRSSTSFKKIVLLAPAILMSPKYIGVLTLISPLRAFGLSIPSRNDPQYRAHASVPLQSYENLLKISKQIQRLKFSTEESKKILVMASEKDELLHIASLKKWCGEHRIKYTPIHNQKNTRCAHMVLNKDELGEGAWKKMITEISNFI